MTIFFFSLSICAGRKDAPFGRSGAGPDAGAALPIPPPLLQAAANSSCAAALSPRHKTGEKRLDVINPRSRGCGEKAAQKLQLERVGLVSRVSTVTQMKTTLRGYG